MREWLWLGILGWLIAVQSYVRPRRLTQPVRILSTRSMATTAATLNNPHHHMELDIAKLLTNFLFHGQGNKLAFDAKLLPSILASVVKSIYPGELFLFILFQLTYKGMLRLAHKLQIIAWKLLHMGTPLEWEKSILGFLTERAALLSRLMGCNYVAKVLCMVLVKVGFRIRSDFPVLLSRISYALYIANFVDLFKSKFLHTFFPGLIDNRRQSYVVKRSTSFIIWTIGVLVACEMVSTYLKVPLTSTLALGGVGGLAIGLSARDIAANFLGGLLLLFNEPFVPGDMVTFRTGNTELVGRVERVGWGQTRIRGRDTRPTYVPNSHFVQTAVTNMERITHRKFEAIIPLRFQDYSVMTDVLNKIKEALRTIPKLDVLSMPFRVSFVKFGHYSLEIEITCYFATKSIDEFLALQQTANLEILKAVRECGASLALPTTQYIAGALDAVLFPDVASVVPISNSNISALSAQLSKGNPLTPATKVLTKPPLSSSTTAPNSINNGSQIAVNNFINKIPSTVINTSDYYVVNKRKEDQVDTKTTTVISSSTSVALTPAMKPVTSTKDSKKNTRNYGISKPLIKPKSPTGDDIYPDRDFSVEKDLTYGEW